MTIIITYGAKQRTPGAWVPVYFVNGSPRYLSHQVKKSERGAISQARRMAETTIEAKAATIAPHVWE